MDHPTTKIQPLIVLWQCLRNAYDAFFMIIFSNLAACALVILPFFIPIPLVAFPLAFFGLALGVTGLYHTNYQLACSEPVDWRTFFEGIRRYFWPGLRWTLINTAVMFSMSFYLLFFASRSETWASILMGLDLGLMAVWILMQMITFPLMLHQEKPGFRSALRNSLVFLVRWPVISFTFMLPALLLIILTLFFPPVGVFFSLGLVAFLCSYLVYFRIEIDRHPELFADAKHIH
jgi:hypothetical protein